MSEDTRRVLELLSQGRITVAEADQLLGAVGASTADPGAGKQADRSERATPKYLRFTVRKTGGWPGASAGDAGGGWRHQAGDWQRSKEVNIRVPIALVKSGVRLGALIPGLAGRQVEARLRAQGLDVDWSKLDAATIDSIVNELGTDMNIDIDAGRSQVHITCE